MKIRYSALKGRRIKKCDGRPFHIEIPDHWYNVDLNIFVPSKDVFDPSHKYSTRKWSYASACYVQQNHVELHSIKAVKRFIARSNMPKGTWFEVSSPYVGHDYKIRK